MIDSGSIRKKYGDDYTATDRTYVLGIDQRFARAMAERFAGKRVLETCTGAGFSTIALARVAAHVTTIEIDAEHQVQARLNVTRAGLLDRVTFVAGDALDRNVVHGDLSIDAAFLDPDWAVGGPEHVYRFRRSNMRPPADELLARALALTPDVAIVLPPLVDTAEFAGLPKHERQELFMDASHELDCLYFGSLTRAIGVTVLRCGDSV